MLFLVAYGIGVSDALARNRIIIVSMVLAVILPVVAAIERLVLNSHEAQKQLWGYTGVKSCLFVIGHQKTIVVLRQIAPWGVM